MLMNQYVITIIMSELGGEKTTSNPFLFGCLLYPSRYLVWSLFIHVIRKRKNNERSITNAHLINCLRTFFHPIDFYFSAPFSYNTFQFHFHFFFSQKPIQSFFFFLRELFMTKGKGRRGMVVNHQTLRNFFAARQWSSSFTGRRKENRVDGGKTSPATFSLVLFLFETCFSLLFTILFPSSLPPTFYTFDRLIFA